MQINWAEHTYLIPYIVAACTSLIWVAYAAFYKINEECDNEIGITILQSCIFGLLGYAWKVGLPLLIITVLSGYVFEYFKKLRETYEK